MMIVNTLNFTLIYNVVASILFSFGIEYFFGKITLKLSYVQFYLSSL